MSEANERLLNPSGVGVAVALLVAVILAGIGYYGVGIYPAPLKQQVGPNHVHYRIYATDYHFSPAHMTWHVGEKVTLTIVNASQSTPGKAHEWFLGRGHNWIRNVFGVRADDQWAQDFFTGVPVHVDSGYGLNEFHGHKAQVTGFKLSMMHRGKPNRPFKQGYINTFQGDGIALKGYASASGNGVPKNATPGPNVLDAAGFGAAFYPPVMVPAHKYGGAITFTFTVPDKPGKWYYACFQQNRQHLYNGMLGTVDVLGGTTAISNKYNEYGTGTIAPRVLQGIYGPSSSSQGGASQ